MASLVILVEGFCPLKIGIVRFLIGFLLKLSLFDLVFFAAVIWVNTKRFCSPLPDDQRKYNWDWELQLFYISFKQKTGKIQISIVYVLADRCVKLVIKLHLIVQIICSRANPLIG